MSNINVKVCSFGVLAHGRYLFLIKLSSLLLEDVEESLGTLQDLVKSTLGFLDCLVIFVSSHVLPSKRCVNDLKSLGECLHLLLDLPLLLLFLVDQVLDLALLLIDVVHHFN